MQDCPINKADFEEMDVTKRTAVVLVFGKQVSNEVTRNFIIKIFLINDFYAVVIFSRAQLTVVDVRTVYWNSGFINTDTIVCASSFSEN